MEVFKIDDRARAMELLVLALALVFSSNKVSLSTRQPALNNQYLI